MTAKTLEAPVAEYGCIDCGLPSDQADLLFYFIILSPFLLTSLVSYFFVRRAQTPIGILRQMAISVPGALPAAIVLALTFEDELIGVVTITLLAAFLWTATFGPMVVFFTQWIFLEWQRIRRNSGS